LKKSTGSVRFYKPETKKTEPNLNRAKPKNRAKPEKTEPNRFEPVFVLKNKPNQNRLVWTGFGVFKKKIQFGYFFFNKNRTEPKMITPMSIFFDLKNKEEIKKKYGNIFSYIFFSSHSTRPRTWLVRSENGELENRPCATWIKTKHNATWYSSKTSMHEI